MDHRLPASTGICASRPKGKAPPARDAVLLADFPAAAFRCDQDGRITAWNPGATKLLGHGAAEMMGRPLTELYPPALREVFRGEFTQLQQSPEMRFEREVETKDGSRLWVEIWALRVEGAAGRSAGVWGAMHAIPHHHYLEEQLLVCNERMRLAARAGGTGIWEMNFKTGEIVWDEKMLQLYGFTAQTDPGGCERWQQTILREDYPAVEQGIAEAARPGGKPFEVQFRIRRQDDGSLQHIQGLATVLRDETGAPVRMIGTNWSITESKENEARRRRLERQLAQAQKMESLGLLAGGIAHDLNSMMTPIIMLSELAVEKHPAGSPTRQLGETILKAASSARDIVRRILAFSRFDEADRRVLLLAPVMTDAEELIRLALPPQIDLLVELPPEPGPAAHVDRVQLQHAILNLGTNAIHAIGAAPGTVTLRLRTCVQETETATLFAPLPAGAYAVIEVADTGCGMERSTLRLIFEPFFTTKPATEGTGLGLSIVRGIVEGLGGAIDVTSNPGEGSCFTVYLPRAEIAEPLPAET